MRGLVYLRLASRSAFRSANGECVAPRRRSRVPPARPRRFELPLVLVVVAVEAQQLPVAAVRRIVVVIVVAVMHGQLAQVRARELARAAAADPRIDLQRLLAIALLALLGCAPRVGDDPVELAGSPVTMLVVDSSFRNARIRGPAPAERCA